MASSVGDSFTRLLASNTSTLSFVRPLPHGPAPLEKGALRRHRCIKADLYQRKAAIRLDVSDHKDRKRQCNKGPSVPPVQEQDEAEALAARTNAN